MRPRLVTSIFFAALVGSLSSSAAWAAPSPSALEARQAAFLADAVRAEPVATGGAAVDPYGQGYALSVGGRPVLSLKELRAHTSVDDEAEPRTTAIIMATGLSAGVLCGLLGTLGGMVAFGAMTPTDPVVLSNPEADGEAISAFPRWMWLSMGALVGGSLALTGAMAVANLIGWSVVRFQRHIVDGEEEAWQLLVEHNRRLALRAGLAEHTVPPGDPVQ